jgi:hypothetical protein
MDTKEEKKGSHDKENFNIMKKLPQLTEKPVIIKLP